MSTTKIKLGVAARGLGESLMGLAATITVQAVRGSTPAVTVAESLIIFSDKGQIIVAGASSDFFVELEPTNGDFCYRWRIETALANPMTFYTEVPASPTPVDFGSLKRVDPHSYQPTEDTVSAWHAVLLELDKHLSEVRQRSAEVYTNSQKVIVDAAKAVEAARLADLDQRATRTSHMSVLELADQVNDAVGDAEVLVQTSSDNAATVTRIKGEVEATRTNVDSLRVSIEGTARQIGTDADTVDDALTSIGLIRTDIDIKVEQVRVIKTDVEGIRTQAVTDVEAVRTQAVADVEGVKTQVDSVAEDVDSDKGEVLQLKTDVLATKTEILDLRASFAAMLDTMGLEFGAIRTGVLDTEARVNTTKSQVAQLKTDTLQIKTETSQLKSDTNQIKTDTLEVKRLTEVARDATVTTKTEVEQLKSDTNQIKTDTLTAKTDAEKARDAALAGQLLGTAITSPADLNTFQTPGRFRFSGSAASSTNMPVATAGILDVMYVTGSTNVRQEFRPFSSTSGLRIGFYVRSATNSSSTWDAWRYVSPTTVVSSADQVGADISIWDNNLYRDLPLASFGFDLGTADLNAIVRQGTYQQQNASYVTLARNYPRVNTGGILRVDRLGSSGGGRLMQTYVIQNGDASAKMVGHYQRRMWDGVWDSWEYVPGQRVDETVGRRFLTFDPVNNRWQMIHGDTGWRDISALLINNWTGTLRIRRTMYRVSIRGSIARGTDSPSTEFLSFIAGFKAYSADDYGVAMQSATARTLTGSSTGLSIPSAPVSSTQWRLITDFDNLEAWPTALPGTALGTIPNS